MLKYFTEHLINHNPKLTDQNAILIEQEYNAISSSYAILVMFRHLIVSIPLLGIILCIWLNKSKILGLGRVLLIISILLPIIFVKADLQLTLSFIFLLGIILLIIRLIWCKSKISRLLAVIIICISFTIIFVIADLQLFLSSVPLLGIVFYIWLNECKSSKTWAVFIICILFTLLFVFVYFQQRETHLLLLDKYTALIGK
jgi:hypothetical protein